MASSQPLVMKTLTEMSTNFSFSIYRDISTSVEGNLFASTFSIYILLGLLLKGSGSPSKTQNELAEVLYFSNLKENLENAQIREAIEDVEVDDILTVANGIFPHKDLDLNSEFELLVRESFKAEIKKLDFAGKSTASESEINGWVQNKTNGKIPKLFEPGSFSANTFLVLASAVHFQNKWKDAFREVKNETFNVDAKNRVDVQMMRQTEYFKYYKDEQNKFAAVEIPYHFGNFDMMVVLPDEVEGLKDLEKQFFSDPAKFPILLNNLTAHKVDMALPKFRFESDLDLKETMIRLGCEDMFLPGANFSSMSASGASNIKVDKMVHKTFVDVNEIGTEAAGVTAVMFVTYSAEYYPPGIKTVQFHANRPFLFIIKKDSDIVFMGRFVKPHV